MNLAAELAAAQEAIRQLYEFAIEELDPEPHPIEAYITDPAAQRAAHAALAAGHNNKAVGS